MSNNYFSFKQFTINQEKAAFKVGTDGVLLGAVADITGTERILDIGSGTGLVAIMLAQKSNAEIVALEPDQESYLQCLENTTLCKWSSRLKVEKSSLQEYHPSALFDLIVSNPPYFSDSLKNPDPRKSFSRHKETLTDDDLLSGVSRLMTENGKLQVIMPYAEGTILIAGAQQYGLYCNEMMKIKPLPSGEIRRLILTFSRHRTKLAEKFLTIEQGKRHEFTEEYIDLTKDFYLKF